MQLNSFIFLEKEFSAVHGVANSVLNVWRFGDGFSMFGIVFISRTVIHE